jgi:hypothetical protein
MLVATLKLRSFLCHKCKADKKGRYFEKLSRHEVIYNGMQEGIRCGKEILLKPAMLFTLNRGQGTTIVLNTNCSFKEFKDKTNKRLCTQCRKEQKMFRIKAFMNTLRAIINKKAIVVDGWV